ncbi:P-loop containing nucleoside triphosphate hydrolase protein [Tuber brumale]|nr:P-loop containing nucleoside triphosphate hydrolase protein [Tuber brumale]
MSRHKNIRNLDPYAELDDFDGGGSNDISPSDERQLQEGLTQVRGALERARISATDKEIEESLWYYYFDVSKTINYILSHHAPAKKPKKKAQSQFTQKAQKGAPTAAQAKAFSEPSPDDIVIAAQSGSKGLNNAKKKTDKPAEKIEAAVQAMAIDNTPVKARKKINILEEFKNTTTKENANFVVIGHVDAGKSTLMGRLLYDCGVIDERTIQKFKAEAEKIGKSSFHFAWVLDQTNEERSRGVTMDIATNHFSTASTNFTILDAPGHRDFVPNMIAGASQADFAVLVLDASTGAFESGFQSNGQTREHTFLARAIGVSRIIVAVNKLDAVSWDHDRYIEITQKIGHFLSSAGFNSNSTSFVPCSGLTGVNIVHNARDKLPWYNGPTLVQALESSKPQSRAISSPLRITISDVFRGGIQNPVSISGRIEAGSLQIADALLALPSEESATVKDIEINERSSEWAAAGHNVTLHLSGIDIIHLKPGDVMCSPDSPIVPLKCFDLKILSFETITPMLVGIHRGRLNASGRVVSLLESMDRTTGKTLKKKPRHIAPGMLARIKVEVTLCTGIPVERGNKLVLRLGGKTVAAGVVE